MSATIALTAATASAEPAQSPSGEQEQVAALRAQVQAQADLMRRNSGRLRRSPDGSTRSRAQNLRVTEPNTVRAAEPAHTAGPQSSPAVHPAGPDADIQRDSVGDLNAGAVELWIASGSA